MAAIAGPGDLAGLAVALANQALTLAYAGDDEDAVAAGETVRVASPSANPTALAMSRFVEGEAFADLDPARASVALEEALRRAEVGNRFVAGIALTALVALRARHGPPAEAPALFREAVEHWRTSRNRALLVTTLRNLVVLLARTGRDEAAAALAASLQEAAPSRSYGVEATRISTALSAVRHRLGDAAWDGTWTAGAARTWRRRPTTPCACSTRAWAAPDLPDPARWQAAICSRPPIVAVAGVVAAIADAPPGRARSAASAEPAPHCFSTSSSRTEPPCTPSTMSAGTPAAARSSWNPSGRARARSTDQDGLEIGWATSPSCWRAGRAGRRRVWPSGSVAVGARAAWIR